MQTARFREKYVALGAFACQPSEQGGFSSLKLSVLGALPKTASQVIDI
jgi:hypothetical protein